ncbi:MAG TPA: YihY/virulence factor BrkB family protein [Tepidisphaeraceae bacterium]|jgi:membrane protein
MPATNVRTALAEQRQTRQQQQQGRSWFAILKASASEWVDADAMTWAAAISCYTVLALAPLLVVAVKVATIVLRQGNAVQKVRDTAAHWMGSDGANAVGAILDKMANQRSGTLAAIISGVLVIVSVGGVFAEIQQAMNRVWKLKPKPGRALVAFIRARLKSIVVLGIAALLILGSIAVAGWISHFAEQHGMGWKFLTWAIDFIATVVALTLIFAMVFKTVPDAEIEWKSTLIGAVLTAVLFALGKYALALYFRFAAPASAFGAVGSLAAVLIWIYYSAQIALFGAVFTQVYAKVRDHGVRPSKHAEFLKELDETETATPSQEDPGSKPPRPIPRRQPSTTGGRAPVDAGYAAVLGQYVPSGHAHAEFPRDQEAEQEQVVMRNLIVAGAGVAFGALLGGYGAMQIRRPKARPAKQVAQARLQRRLDTVEQKVAHASRVKEFLEQDDANERLDEIRQRMRIRESRSRAKTGSARLRPPRPEP